LTSKINQPRARIRMDLCGIIVTLLICFILVWTFATFLSIPVTEGALGRIRIEYTEVSGKVRSDPHFAFRFMSKLIESSLQREPASLFSSKFSALSVPNEALTGIMRFLLRNSLIVYLRKTNLLIASPGALDRTKSWKGFLRERALLIILLISRCLNAKPTTMQMSACSSLFSSLLNISLYSVFSEVFGFLPKSTNSSRP
jgi:hypothetical protein